MVIEELRVEVVLHPGRRPIFLVEDIVGHLVDVNWKRLRLSKYIIVLSAIRISLQLVVDLIEV